MARLEIEALPEVFVSTKRTASTISRACKSGRLRRLAPRLYTKNLHDAPEQIVRRNIWSIAGLLFPGAIVADRTALEHVPAQDGSVFLVSSIKRDTSLPGHVLRARKGKGPINGDQPFLKGLYLSSPARAYLENMRTSRARKSVSRRLGREELEQKLERELSLRGQSYLNALRDQSRAIAPQLGLEKEAVQLSQMVGALLGTRETKLHSTAGIARRAGRPFDTKRIDIFLTLHEQLMKTDAPLRAEPEQAIPENYLPFFEAYFSNFIEGTEFEITEASAIVFENRIPRDRPQDAHDILGTYRVVSDDEAMRHSPRNFRDFVDTLRSRHAQILSARPEKAPGVFKVHPNQVGSTHFVLPELVEGTLERGFEILQTIPYAFHRAVFVMFLVTEVHPFVDGNGRLARIMMNTELVSRSEKRILVPTIYRNNYLAALRAISLGHSSEPIIRMLSFAQKYTAAIDFSDYDRAVTELRRTHAFMDPGVADAEGVRLMLP